MDGHQPPQAHPLPPLLGAVGPAWVEIDLDAMAWNVTQVRQAVAPARLCAVVKADAYGHGAVESARAILSAGADMVGVSTLPEALELRAAGIDAPTLVFTPLFPQDADLLAAADVIPTIVSSEAATALARAARARPLPFHVKVDTGMGRYGVSADELPAFVRSLASWPEIQLAGVYTHFARPGQGSSRQLERFLRAVEATEERTGVRIPLRHAASSAAVASLPDADLDMVRVGNLLYGMRPPGDQHRIPDLRPAWRLRAAVAQVRTLPAGARIGYGSEVVLRRTTRTAMIPLGFADGIGTVPSTRMERLGPLLRALARLVLRTAGLEGMIGRAAGTIEIGGRAVRPLGRMSMQQTIVDAGDLEGVHVGDVASVHCRPSAASARLPRVYVRDGTPWRVRTPAGSFDLDALAAVASANGRRPAAHPVLSPPSRP